MITCDVCPRGCRVDRYAGQRGSCGADTYLEIAHWQVHHWEEPPISGTAGSGTVFFAHCNLGCVYCQNHVISSGSTRPRATPSTPSDLGRICISLQDAGVMNVNLVTPTHYAPAVREGIRIARDMGLDLPIVWNTSGYESTSQIEANDGLVDVYLTDMKYADPRLGAKLSGVPDYPDVAMEAIGRMIDQVGPPAYDDFEGDVRMTSGVIIRHMLLPGHIDDSIEVLRMLRERFGDSFVLSVMDQYTPVLSTRAGNGDVFAAGVLERFPELAHSVSQEEYEALLDVADSLGFDDYHWQDGDACSESFIPVFGRKI